MKKCIEYEVEGSRPRGRPKRAWREIVVKDCEARKLNKEDSVDRCTWTKWIKDSDDQDVREWANVSSGTGSPD